MKLKLIQARRFLTAGSVAAALIAAALLPFNIGGGCSAANVDLGAVVQGSGQVLHGLSLSEKDEKPLGQAVALQATATYPLYPDEKLNRYVTLVGRTVASGSLETGYKYYFGILDTDKPNAFSGPHGYIFITRGALKRMKNEAELAGVLGHEIGHVSKHHGLADTKNAIMAAGGLKIAEGANRQMAEFSGGADAMTNVILNTGYSEPQELEADAEGVKYMMAVGYDPHAYLHFLQRLKQEQAAGEKPFGTHPGLGDRIKRVADQIKKAGADAHGVLVEERFQQAVVFPG